MEFEVKVTGSEGLMEVLRETVDSKFKIEIRPVDSKIKVQIDA